MPYLNIDEDMPEHPKVDVLSDAAFRLHVAAMAYAARHLTDGVIPRPTARRLTATGDDVVISELIAGGLWHDVGQPCTRLAELQRLQWVSKDARAKVEADARACHEPVVGAYILHDFLQWNHSAEWWADRREKDAQRIAKFREKRRRNAEQTADEPPDEPPE